MPYMVTLTLYNSAGEVVLNLFQGRAEDAPTELKTTSDTMPTGILPDGSKAGSIGFIFQGALEGYGNGPTSTVYWQGLNNSAQMVGGGTYYAKLDVSDSFGAVASYTKEISVIQATTRQSLTIYNSAGEAVTHLALAAATGSRLDIKDSTQAVTQDPYTGAVVGGFQINLVQPDGSLSPSSQLWPGTNDRGQLLDPGSYTVELVSEEAGGPTVRETKSIVLLRSPGASGLASAVIGPQPWRGGVLQLWFQPLAMAGDGIHVRVYNAAAELVLQDFTPASSGSLNLASADKLASGIYLVELTWVRGEALMERRVIKLAVAR
jgi:hypothetical protein